MRVAFYNQMFGMDGRGFFSMILAHWAIHFQSDMKQIWKRVDLDRTIKLAKQSKADILGIAEVIEGQERNLSAKLKELGYKYVFFGKGHRTKYNKRHISVALASKIRCVKKDMCGFPNEDCLGGGAGALHCFFPSLNLNIINIHFSIIQKKDLLKAQINFLKNSISKIKNKMIIIGDFNTPFNKIKDNFENMILASKRIKTCSLTNVVKFFNFIDTDHIIVRGLKPKRAGFLEGASDHRLVYVDLK